MASYNFYRVMEFGKNVFYPKVEVIPLSLSASLGVVFVLFLFGAYKKIKFLSHVDGNLFSMTPVESHHWRIARGWIGLFNTSLRTLDALHLAIASAEDFVLVTSDRRLIQAADILGVTVRAMSGNEDPDRS